MQARLVPSLRLRKTMSSTATTPLVRVNTPLAIPIQPLITPINEDIHVTLATNNTSADDVAADVADAAADDEEVPPEWKGCGGDFVLAHLLRIEPKNFGTNEKPFYKSYKNWKVLTHAQKDKAYTWFKKLHPVIKSKEDF
jgi:hypothetical protein